jgi:predicted component of type VI protein secretion system
MTRRPTGIGPYTSAAMQRAHRATTRLGALLLLAAALVAGVLLSGCDTTPENANQVSEGEGMKLGDLLYNVQITRILNPQDAEDKAYLVGQPELGSDQYYLGVFMTVENEASSSAQIPAEFTVEDTVGTEFQPVPSTSLFALKVGTTLHGGDQLPEPESTAANGPIEGAMVLFRITGSAIQDRPLTLHIPSSTGAAGEVELDI